jgi:hypothetical protein
LQPDEEGVLVGLGVSLGTGVLVDEGLTGGSPTGSAVLVGVAVGAGGGCVGGALVFVLVGTGLEVLVCVGALVHVGHTVTGVSDAVGLMLAVAVIVVVAVAVMVGDVVFVRARGASVVSPGVRLALLDTLSAATSMTG